MRPSSFLKFALICALIAGPQAGMSYGWSIDVTQGPWHEDPSYQGEYCVYNNTGERVFIYHDKTGIKYTIEPGQTGYPAHRGEKLKFHPSEIRCGFVGGNRQCVVRLAPFGYDPVLVLEALPCPQQRATSPQIGPPPSIKTTREIQPPERDIRRASAPAPATREPGDLPELLKLILERMVHVYHRERGEAKDRKLSQLKQSFARNFSDILPRETAAKLKQYEALCQCIHEQIDSGLSLDEIFREGRCGTRSTKELRNTIVRDFAERIKLPSSRSSM